MIKIGITGGIGSGKSTVCRIFAERGIAVYDSDAAAKRLMQEDVALREKLTARFGAATYPNGILDRKYLASIVFKDAVALADLDAAVHPAVWQDFERWVARQQGEYVLFESAILFECALASQFDKTVAVLAPRALRIERVCRRDGSNPEAVEARIAAQDDDDTVSARADYTIVNIHEDELAEDVARLDKIFRDAAARA